MYEGRIKKLNETTKKMKGQKRRRPNDDGTLPWHPYGGDYDLSNQCRGGGGGYDK